MKKLVAVLLGLSMILSAGCNKDKDGGKESKNSTDASDKADPDDDSGGMADGQQAALDTRLPAAGAAVDSSDAEYLRRRLSAAFAKLPPVLREAYTLFQIGDMSIREIANQTGVSENLVKVRIFRAKEKLKEILADLRVTC